jgi:uncharacterized protein (TIGR02246 family)
MKCMPERRATASLLIVAAMCMLASCAAQSPADLTDADRRAIQALDSSFVAAWLRDDTTAIMATLSSDAVLMPAGRHPLAGHAAIRAFWWPTDGSHTTINTFVSRIDEIGGNSDLAYVLTNDSLTFTYTKGATQQTQSNRTMSLAVVARRADGRWQTIRKMWGPLVVPPR